MLAIQQVFPDSKNNICSWHVQQVLKKRFAFLNRGNNENNKKIYRTIIQLPFSDYPIDFKTDLNFILKQKSITIEHKKFFRTKAENKEKWVKGFMKSDFCCGMCTSSRIESKHRVFKKFLRSSTPLTKFFEVCKEIEEKEIYTFQDEIQKCKVRTNNKLEKSKLIKFFNNEFSEYSIAKLKDQLIESTNYKLAKSLKESW